jgi:hypothetical protein
MHCECDFTLVKIFMELAPCLSDISSLRSKGVSLYLALIGVVVRFSDPHCGITTLRADAIKLFTSTYTPNSNICVLAYN